MLFAANASPRWREQRRDVHSVATFRTSGRKKTRKTSKMKSGLLFDPFVVVFDVVVVIFSRVCLEEKSGEISIDFPSLCVLITLERTTRTNENLSLLQI